MKASGFRARRQALSVVAASFVGAALLYRFPLDRYGFYPVCPVHQYTGLLCPGCGGTRALGALVHGHFAAALHWNPLVVVACGIVAGKLAMTLWRGRWVAVRPWAMGLAGLVCAAFTVFRNFT